MELILIIIAGGVMYYLYYVLKDYLNNEENQQRFARKEVAPQVAIQEMSAFDKVRLSEYGTLTGILAYIAHADKEVCVLENEVAYSLIEDMAVEMQRMSPSVKKDLKEIFDSPTEDIQTYCERFKELTKGEYKKKLKVLEFCFMMGYADGILNEQTKEAIIDIGALLEVDNEDFNQIYDKFLQINDVEISLQEAKELYDYTPQMSKEDLLERYHQLIAQTKQNILDENNLNKTIDPQNVTQLQKIQKAYDLLVDLPQETQSQESSKTEVSTNKGSWDF